MSASQVQGIRIELKSYTKSYADLWGWKGSREIEFTKPFHFEFSLSGARPSMAAKAQLASQNHVFRFSFVEVLELTLRFWTLRLCACSSLSESRYVYPLTSEKSGVNSRTHT